MTTDKDDMQSASAELSHSLPVDHLGPSKDEISICPESILPYTPVQGIIYGFISAAILLFALVSLGLLVPIHVVSGLQGQIGSLRIQNDALKGNLERSDRKLKEYEATLHASPGQVRSQIAKMQATIEALEQQIEAVRATEWPPLTAAAQEALYHELKALPAREVWVGYADSGGRALAKTISNLFNRLNWPQKHDILAVLDPQDGLWITPISDFSEQVREKIVQATGLQFKIFPHREQLPDDKQIGIIIGYRTPIKQRVNP